MKVDLEKPLKLKEAAKIIGAEGQDGGEIKFICTDSREVSDGGLFFALGKGENFVSDVLGRGFAVSSVCREALFVPDTKTALLKLAAYYKSRLEYLKTTIAITGSVGKTSVKDYTAAILGKKYKTHKTEGNFNNEIGLPLTVFKAPEKTEALVLEMGMNERGEIERLSRCARPDIAVITNIGSSHMGKLGSKEEIGRAKREILLGLSPVGKVIIPSDEPLLEDILPSVKVGEGGEIGICDVREYENDTRFRIKTPLGLSSEICFPFSGIHFAKNLALAVAASISAGLDLEDINDAFSDYSQFIPRQKYIKIKDFFIYDDSYNASLESYEADFKMLSSKGGVYSSVIGDIKELGKFENEIHEKLGIFAKEYGLSKIYPFGENAVLVAKGALKAGFPIEKIFTNENPNKPEYTARLILENSSSGETVLIKGSRALRTEKIIEALKTL